jgi:predicted RNA-binding Zn ribbon-like protein
VTPQLGPDGRVRRPATTRQLLASVALDTLELLAGPDFDRVRECSNAECTRLYVDSSRSQNRRWCGMTECGNRAKAEAFRRRHR